VDGLTLLALEAGRGDPAARDAFVKNAYPEVWQLCAALVDRDSADDLAQDSFARAVRALPRFRAEASARTWLLAITRRACMDELRRRHRRRRREAERRALGLDVEPRCGDPADARSVVDLLDRLAPDRRAAFLLTQQLGLTYEEAAAVCDCPTGTIRSRVARARADLVRLLADADADDAVPGDRPVAAPPA
jgi:RNA polymerase sigma-70 factor (ECF subfamily)